MRIHRADPLINDAIEALNQRLVQAKHEYPKGSDDEHRALAWKLFSPIERQFVRDEIAKCVSDRLYYLSNYHTIQPEHGPLTCLHPLYDLQGYVEEALQRKIAEEGRAYLVILKPRQSGITEYTNGVMCWRTFFLPQAFTLTVAQDPPTAAWVQRKVGVAWDNLPYWMRPERQYFNKGEYAEFQRRDQVERTFNPGLGTIMVTTHCLRDSGVAIGKTIRSLHMTETGWWEASDLYSSDIKPTMHAPDTIAIAESTPHGMNNFHYNLWQAANDPTDDDGDWTPLYLPAYRDRKNLRTIRPKQQPFVLTDVEKKVQERVQQEEGFTIPLEFWNFRRRGIKDSINESGFPYGHLECYSITAREAFQSSGYGAFARHKLDEQEANIRRPLHVGEVIFQGRNVIPKVMLEDLFDYRTQQYRNVSLPKRGTMGARLYLWEKPDPAAIYYIAADAGEGIGQDYSVVEVLKAGYLNEPDIQVGEWVGNDEPPEAFARIIYAIGLHFNLNGPEVAVEFNGPGRSTANYLMNQLEYPHIYIPRREDHFKAQIASFAHWQSTPKTKPLLKNKMNETLLENGIVIQSEYALEELRACESTGESFSAPEGHDDAAMSLCIALYCLRQTAPDLRRPTGSANSSTASTQLARALHPPLGTKIFGVYDELFRLRASPRSLAEAEEYIKGNPDKNMPPHPAWGIRPIVVNKVNTAHSVIHHQRGIENELYQAGMIDREITPGIVTQFAAATGRLEGMFNSSSSSFGAASPGADAAQWDSSLGGLGSGELSDGGEMW
ncbi:MAG: hypothetical protein KGL39_40405 [Patescibacteria group bacterium]|nr:hypothetical protein [Patescibacteria group bacterium]